RLTDSDLSEATLHQRAGASSNRTRTLPTVCRSPGAALLSRVRPFHGPLTQAGGQGSGPAGFGQMTSGNPLTQSRVDTPTSVGRTLASCGAKRLPLCKLLRKPRKTASSAEEADREFLGCLPPQDAAFAL